MRVQVPQGVRNTHLTMETVMRVETRHSDPALRAAHSRLGSKIENRALKLWRQEHAEEWGEAWPVVLHLVDVCYHPATPNARHTAALNVMRSALVREHPEAWAETRRRARLAVAA